MTDKANKNKFLNIIYMALFLAILVLFMGPAERALACDYYGEYGDDCIYIECDCDDDCGNSTFIGDPFCQNGNVYRDYRTCTCLNPGTEDAECSCSTQPKLWYECESWQTCQDGSCTNLNVECNSNSECGVNGYVDEPFCQNGDVYKNYKTYTCSNPGTPNAYCSNKTTAKLQQNCTSNQVCQNGSCSTDCTAHSYKQCSGSYLYWYDSCGSREGVAEYCENGCYNNQCKDYYNVSVQTNSATNVYNEQATLNGYLYDVGSDCNTYVWFEYGPTTSYEYQTTHQYKNYSGSFNQIVNLYSYNTYHFRAAAQNCQGTTVYGQDRTIYNTTDSTLTINKTVRNLTTGSGFASSVSANPLDMLMFMITLKTSGNQSAGNAYVKDYLPNNLIYKGQLVVSGANYTGDINSGINIGSFSSNQTVTITYQAQVASAQNFSYGTTTLNNSVSVTGSNSNYNPISNASVFVTRSGVYGASTISTGLTNNFWIDSFFLPLALVLLIVWMWRAGIFFGIEKWLDNKKKVRKTYSSGKELNKRIATIQRTEN